MRPPVVTSGMTHVPICTWLAYLNDVQRLENIFLCFYSVLSININAISATRQKNHSLAVIHQSSLQFILRVSSEPKLQSSHQQTQEYNFLGCHNPIPETHHLPSLTQTLHLPSSLALTPPPLSIKEVCLLLLLVARLLYIPLSISVCLCHSARLEWSDSRSSTYSSTTPYSRPAYVEKQPYQSVSSKLLFMS